MKVNRYGQAAILTAIQINLLFNEGFTKPRDKALFGVCLYAAARINEACTLLRGDVIGGWQRLTHFTPISTLNSMLTMV